MEVDGEEEEDENDFWDEEQHDEDYDHLMQAWPTQDSRAGGRRRSASPPALPRPSTIRAEGDGVAGAVAWARPEGSSGPPSSPQGATLAMRAVYTVTERLFPCSSPLDP